jgi:hypothetical protein
MGSTQSVSPVFLTENKKKIRSNSEKAEALLRAPVVRRRLSEIMKGNDEIQRILTDTDELRWQAGEAITPPGPFRKRKQSP